jgi:hypothetical protein
MFFLRLPDEYQAVCYFCDEMAADWFCEDCGKYYCRDCIQEHACQGSNLLRVVETFGS